MTLRQLLHRIRRRRRAPEFEPDDGTAVLHALRVDRDMPLDELLALDDDALLERLETWSSGIENFNDWYLAEIEKGRELLLSQRARAEIRGLPKTDERDVGDTA